MQITNHAKERYVERVKDIRRKSEIKQYIAQNDKIITEHILKLYEYAELVYTGQIGGDKTTADFYLNNDICLVVDGTCIRTIYRINFAFPEKTRLMVINDLKEEISTMQADINEEMKEMSCKYISIDNQIANAKTEIERLRDEINIKEDAIKLHEAEKALASKEIRLKNKKLQHYAEQLFGNTEYKSDIT